MDKSLFRKKSLDRISSPEELHDYMRVTSPRLWMVLAVIIALLAGFLIYASTATMENTMPITVTVEQADMGEGEDATAGEVVLVFAQRPLSDMEILKPGMVLRVAGEEGKISSLYSFEDEVGVMFDMNNPHLSLRPGTYEGELVLESVTPISFLLN